jgi:hypothetical protein
MCSQLPSKGAFLANLSTNPTPPTSEACGICGNPFGQKYFEHPDHNAFPISSGCKHTYHRHCILSFLKTHNHCPADEQHYLYHCRCSFCKIHERLDAYVQTFRLAGIF